MFDLSFTEVLVIILVGVVLFGSKRIPDVARALGRSLNAFKSGLKEGMDEDEKGKEAKKPAEDAKP